MGRGEELSDFQRGTVVGCHLCHKSTREISALLALPQSTVSSVIVKWKRERITTTLPRSGRPQKLREEHRQILERLAREKRFTSIEALTADFQSASGAVVSSNTIRRELHEMGFRGRVSSYSQAGGGKRVAKKQQAAAAAAAPQREDGDADVSRLDLSAEQLPDGDGLYVQQLDVGESSPSELARNITVDQPAVTSGLTSQALLLSARSSDGEEILQPPGGAAPGDAVTCRPCSGDPDKASTLEEKAWEDVQPDRRPDARRVAAYKGAALPVEGKRVCTAKTMTNCEIK